MIEPLAKSVAEPTAGLVAARLIPLLDLTSLGEDDTPERVERWCAVAIASPLRPAAVCIYPEHVTTARRCVEGSGIRVATVVNFPDGADDAGRIVRETRRALAAGADEIDMVFPYRAFLGGAVESARRGVEACRRACERATLKLILETGELGDAALVRAAARIGVDAGADFLKTSTGKVAVNATPAAAAILLEVIAETGARCGFKAAGGIRTAEDAAAYLRLAETTLGPHWVHPSRFRIGASVLFDALRRELASA